MAWLRACALDDLTDGESVVVERAPDPPIAVFNVGGELYAIDDTCTHDKYSLADGYLDGDVVECALHLAKFNVRTGKVLSPPATRDLGTYDVRVDDGVVLVDV